LHRHVGPQLESQVEYARTGVVELQELAAQIGQLAEVLADDAEAPERKKRMTSTAVLLRRQRE
jgi:hypothetical protein